MGCLLHGVLFNVLDICTGSGAQGESIYGPTFDGRDACVGLSPVLFRLPLPLSVPNAHR